MKKTLAILLSCVVIVAALFALTMFTSAETETYATTVEVTLDDGSVVYLGQQPEGEGYSTTNIINFLTLKNKGTMDFDHTSGTLTINNVDGVKKVNSTTGSLVLVVEGENTFESTDRNVNVDGSSAGVTGNLTIKGTGILTAKGSQYNICSANGNVEIVGNVTLDIYGVDGVHASIGDGKTTNNHIKFGENANVTVTSSGNAIRTNAPGSDIYFAEFAKVKVKNSAGIAIQTQDKLYVLDSAAVTVESAGGTNLVAAYNGTVQIAGGSLSVEATGPSERAVNAKNLSVTGGELKVIGTAYTKDMITGTNTSVYGGTVTVNATTSGNWVAAVNAATYSQIGGKVTLNATCGTNALAGLKISSTATFSGGELDITVGSNNASGKNVFGIHFNGATKADFSGTIVNLNVTNNVYDSTNYNSAVICLATDNNGLTVNVSGGLIQYQSDINTQGFFVFSRKATVNISGGAIKGTCRTFLFNRNNAGGTVNITGGVVDTTSLSKNCNWQGTVGNANWIAVQGSVTTAYPFNAGSTTYKTGTVNVADYQVQNGQIPSAPTVPTKTLPTTNMPSKNFTGTTTAAVGENSASTGNPYVTEKGIYWVAGNTMTVSQDRFVKINASLKDDIALTYYAIYDEATANKAQFTVNDYTPAPVEGVFDEKTGLYAYRFDGISPQMMGDTVRAELLPAEGATPVATKEYSVKKYLAKLKTEHAGNEKLVALVNDLLIYGGAAQTYKGYKTDALVSNGIAGSSFTDLEASASVAGVMNNQNGKVFTFDRATVFFDGKNKLAFQFTTAVEGVTFAINEGAKGEGYTLNGNTLLTDGINATEFGKTFTIVAYEGETVVAKVRYSVNSYVYAMQNKGGNIAALAKATYNYGAAAVAYAQ